MLLVIVGAGASHDSIPTRPYNAKRRQRQGDDSLEEYRLPLADQLFEPRDIFEDIQRLVPQVMQIAPSLFSRMPTESVEDVLARYASQSKDNPDRLMQLAAVRFYLQGVIVGCERRWYREKQVPTNLMALIDQIEGARRNRERPLFVTFNYDRLIENALENRGQSLHSLPDYVYPERTNVIKLHGSVDWARLIRPFDQREFGGAPWEIARQICAGIATLGPPGDIVFEDSVPSSVSRKQLAIPAMAIPVKSKSHFECPDEHVERLRTLLPRIKTLVTLGWRGSEQRFLDMLRATVAAQIEVICVGYGEGSAEETIESLRPAIPRAHFEPYNRGFSTFIAERKVERLLNITWTS